MDCVQFEGLPKTKSSLLMLFFLKIVPSGNFEMDLGLPPFLCLVRVRTFARRQILWPRDAGDPKPWLFQPRDRSLPEAFSHRYRYALYLCGSRVSFVALICWGLAVLEGRVRQGEKSLVSETNSEQRSSPVALLKPAKFYSELKLLHVFLLCAFWRSEPGMAGSARYLKFSFLQML